MTDKPGTENRSEETTPDGAGPQGTMFIRMTGVQDGEGPARLTSGHSSHAALIGINEPFRGKRFRLEGNRVTVGSKADAGNDIVLPESTVSFMHARLIHEQGRWRILNILSTNGTFVNGKKIIEAPVGHGDRVRFGAVEFVFQDSADASADAAAPDEQETTPAAHQWAEGNLWWLLLAAVVVAMVVLSFALA